MTTLLLQEAGVSSQLSSHSPSSGQGCQCRHVTCRRGCRRLVTPQSGAQGACPEGKVLLSITTSHPHPLGHTGDTPGGFEDGMGRTSNWALGDWIYRLHKTPAEAGKKPQSLTTHKTIKNQYETTELHRTLRVSNRLQFIHLKSISQYSYSAELLFCFLLMWHESWTQIDFSLFLFIHVGTTYNSNVIFFYCVPEWKLPVWSE